MKKLPRTVVKIGGGILTDKTCEKTLNEDSLKRVAKTVACYNQDLILVHGAGSYGHPQAKRIGLSKGAREGIQQVFHSIKELNQKIIEELYEHDVKACPVHPSSCSYINGELEMMASQVEKMLEEGFTPVLHGDAVVTSGKGFTAVSGDRLVRIIAEKLKIKHVGMCTSVPGVLDEQDRVVDRVNSPDIAEKESDGIDVTGGIKNKVKELLKLESGGRIFGEHQLEAFLNGEEVGTLVAPERQNPP